ncbi:MAG TPA: hypothetical protein VEY93_06250 [Longimicrobium sp.]|nr:hypothetical protein [Longimicrobium sp.]
MTSLGQATFFTAAETALSTHRLRLGFQDRAGDTPELLLGRHLRNLALSEALYPVLQTLELTLRNSIDHTLQAAFPASASGHDWLSSTSVVLTPRDRDEVSRVELHLRAPTRKSHAIASLRA